MITKKLCSAVLLFEAAEAMGLRPEWLGRSSIFAFYADGSEHYVNYAKSSLNSQLSSSLVGNKNATRLVLARKGFPTMAHIVPREQQDAHDFLALHKKIIAKPVKGSNSRDVHIVESPAELPAFHERTYILEEYAPGKELRYLLLNGRVIAVHESCYGVSVAHDRPLTRISYPPTSWDTDLVDLSVDVARAFGLRYAAVDYIIGQNGKARILEVNSSPGMKWFHSPTSGPGVNVADLFLEAMLADSTQHKTPKVFSVPRASRVEG